MAADSAVQVAVGMTTGDLKAGAQEIASSMSQLSRSIQAAMGTVPQTTKPATQAVEGLGESIKKFRSEQIQQARQAGFFARELTAIIPAADGAKNSLQALIGFSIEGLLGGSMVMLAIQGIQALVAVYGDLTAAEKKAAKESEELMKKRVESYRSGVEAMKKENTALGKALYLSRGGRSEDFDAYSTASNTDALEAAQAVVNQAKEALRVENERLRVAGYSKEARIRELAPLTESLRMANAELNLAEDRYRIAVRTADLEANKREKAEFTVGSDAPTPRSFMPENPWAGVDSTKAVTDPFSPEAAVKREMERMKLETKSRDTARKIADDWMAVGDSIATSVGRSFAAVIKGQMTVAQGMKAIASSIISTFLEMVKKIVMANAVSAAAGAASSQSGIPVIGPILAASAMVAMLSLVQGLIGDMPSAAGGWDRVPYDTMAMVHKDEKILPADKAAKLDAMLDGGGGRGSVNVTINAVDAKSVRRLLLENDAALAEAIGQAQRKGRLG